MMTQHFEVLVFCFVLALTDSCVIRVMALKSTNIF